MTPVTLLSEIQDTPGALGYSALVTGWFGTEPKRKTMWYVRDREGFAKHVLILDAAAEGAAY